MNLAEGRNDISCPFIDILFFYNRAQSHHPLLLLFFGHLHGLFYLVGKFLYIKRVDAGLVCDHFFSGHPRRQPELGIDIKQIIDICRTKLIPTRVFAARPEISKAVVAKVNQALLRLDKEKHAHTKILSRAELGGFQKSKDEDYDGIRMLIGDKTTG